MNLTKAHNESKRKSNKQKIMLFAIALVVVVAIVILLFMGEHKAENITNSQNISIRNEEQFLTEMISHHQEAIDSAKIVLAKTQNTGVSRVADSIVSGQTAEIVQMSSWKKDWYGFSLYHAKYHSMMPDLSGYKGTFEDDKVFLEAMIKHHEMAVEMARQVLALEPRSEIVTFANGIITTQTAEMAFMQRILNN